MLQKPKFRTIRHARLRRDSPNYFGFARAYLVGVHQENMPPWTSVGYEPKRRVWRYKAVLY